MTWVEFVWHVFKRRVSNPTHTSGTYFCSAYAYKMMLDSGAKLDGFDPSVIDPTYVQNACVLLSGVHRDFAELISRAP